jgi:hypothetical protein
VNSIVNSIYNNITNIQKIKRKKEKVMKLLELKEKLDLSATFWKYCRFSYEILTNRLYLSFSKLYCYVINVGILVTTFFIFLI